MIRAFRLLFIVCIVTSFAVGYHYRSIRTSHRFPAFHDPHPQPASEGSRENPEGRDQWEWMRLHDPATGKIPENIRAKELAFAATIPARAQSESFFKTMQGATAQSYNWQPRGPYNVGGRTRAFGADRQNEDIFLAGGVTGGMWRSTDGGATWTRATQSNQLPSVTCLAQDTRTGHENTWYYGTGEFRTNVQRFGNANYYGDGIFKSTDDGVTWRQIPSTVSATIANLVDNFQYVNNIVLDTSNASQDVLYAATYGAIMRSSNGGDSWTAALGSDSNTVGFTNVAVASDGSVYAGMGSGGTTHGIWRSADGAHWTDITPSAWWSDSTRGVSMDVASSDSTVLYVLAETPHIGQRVPSSYVDSEWYSLWRYTYKSGAGGGTWTNLSNNIPLYGSGNYENYNGLASYAMIVRISPYSINTILLGGTDLYVSTDGFTTTAHTYWLGGYDTFGNYGSTNAELHPDQHTLVFSHAHPGKIYIGNDGGVFSLPRASTSSDTSFTPLDNGYVTGQFYTTALDHLTQGSMMVVGGLQDNGSWESDSLNSKIAWGNLFGGDGSFCAIGDSGKSIYVSSQFATTVGIVTHGTATNGYLVMYNNGLPTTDLLFVNPFALDPNNNAIMYMPFGSSLQRNTAVNTSNAFNGWQKLSNTATTDNSLVTTVGVSTANPVHRVYYGTSSGRLFFMDGANQGDPNPTEITGTDFPIGGYINCVAVDPFDGNRALVVFSNYNVQSLFYTSDGGNSWAAVGGNLEQNPDGTGNGPSCRWATILHRGTDTLYLVGTSTGLYSTTTLDNLSEANPSVTWVQEGATTIGNAIVDMVDARQSDGYVTVATWGNGMYSAMIPTINTEAVSEPANSSPQSVQLYQNYPNPFGGAAGNAATIRFTIPTQSSGQITLVLYDEEGREVRTLASGNFSAGEHEATLNANDLPSGTYYYRLRAGGLVQTKSVQIMQ